jgi:DNA-binding NarL/FixJ family response regulator
MDGRIRAQHATYEEGLGKLYLAPKITLLIVDDQLPVRRRLQMRLSQESDIAVVAEAGDGATALNLAQRLRPNVILMDIEMPGMSGIWATRVLHGLMPECKVVILTAHDDELKRIEAKAAGAMGFVGKQETDSVLLSTIRQVASE